MTVKNLTLHLKAKWYDMIERGEKLEEYRDITAYWYARLVDYEEGNETHWRHYDTVTFYYGYTKRKMVFECKGIDRGLGNTEWGAELYKYYYVIHLGKRLPS